MERAHTDSLLHLTSIGSEFKPDFTSNISMIDCHNKCPNCTPPLANHHHNPRVDLCAPGYTNTLSSVDANGNPEIKRASGTSFAAPLVSATMALMLGVNPCLSPYQLEYLIKKNSNDSVYKIAENDEFKDSGYPTSKAYNRLGTGRLDAYEAVKAAKTFKCNDSKTQAMSILKIGLNHACLGLTGNPIRLTPFLVNANTDTSNMIFTWTPLDGNTVIFSAAWNYATVLSSTANSHGEHILYYLLTVTEKPGTTGNYPPKSASKRIKVKLRKSGVDGWDLAMRDSYSDSYNQPNDMEAVDAKAWNIWLSPDLWNRQTSTLDTVPQDIEYFSSNPNYVFVRVRNVGCISSPANKELHLYWSKSSTGEKWPQDWTTTEIQGKYTSNMRAGGEITPNLLVPSLGPGEDIILSRAWYPPKPDSFQNAGDGVPLCLLARLYDSTNGNKGLSEINGNVKPNVVNNNNIVTRNLQLLDGDPLNLTRTHQVDFSNAGLTTQAFTLEVINDKDINKYIAGDLSEIMYGVLHLGTVFDKWQTGGSLGYAGTVDEGNKSVTFDFSSPISLKNISLDAGERLPVTIEFKLRDNVAIPDTINTMVHFRQLETDGNGNEIVYGNMSYGIYFEADSDTSGSRMNSTYLASQTISSNNRYSVYPNPMENRITIKSASKTNTPVDILITDVTGRVVFKREQEILSPSYEVNTKTFTPGTYFVNIKSTGSSETFKMVKIE